MGPHETNRKEKPRRQAELLCSIRGGVGKQVVLGANLLGDLMLPLGQKFGKRFEAMREAAKVDEGKARDPMRWLGGGQKGPADDGECEIGVQIPREPSPHSRGLWEVGAWAHTSLGFKAMARRRHRPNPRRLGRRWWR